MPVSHIRTYVNMTLMFESIMFARVSIIAWGACVCLVAIELTTITMTTTIILS